MLSVKIFQNFHVSSIFTQYLENLLYMDDDKESADISVCISVKESDFYLHQCS